MQKLSISTTYVPRTILESPATAEEAMRICPICNALVEPRRVEWGRVVRYRPGQCVCEVEAAQKAKAERELQEWRESAYGLVYGWVSRHKEASPLQGQTFASFDASRQPEAYALARYFAREPKGTLILHGNFGTGKTHLLAAICNEGIERHKRLSLFTTTTKLFTAIQECIQRQESYTAIIDRASLTPLLVLDDIDKAKRTDFREEIYFSIIDERVTHGLPTAISTNRIDELANFVGGAVADRLRVGQIAVPMLGESYRGWL